MNAADVICEGLGRVADLVPRVVDGLSPDQLQRRVDGRGNSIAWLVWHLTRVQDDHLCDAAGTEQVWFVDGWQTRFDLDLPGGDTGYGHAAEDVERVRAGAELLTGYHAAVAEASERFVRGLSTDDLDRVVDERWSPPVTLGVRLVSVLSDCLQHLGQASYVRGLHDY